MWYQNILLKWHYSSTAYMRSIIASAALMQRHRNEDTLHMNPGLRLKTYPRQQVRRSKDRAQYQREQCYAILDAARIAHVGFSMDNQPFVIPMLYARDGDSILLHGSVASRLQVQLANGIETCISVTLLDALVLARSQFHHSVNYRSVVAFGRAQVIDNAAEKVAALIHIVDTLIPGRAHESRPGDAQEVAATTVLRLALTDISAKVRSGGPKDAEADRGLPIWAGVVPLQTRHTEPQPAADLAPGITLPESVQRLINSSATTTT